MSALAESNNQKKKHDAKVACAAAKNDDNTADIKRAARNVRVFSDEEVSSKLQAQALRFGLYDARCNYIVKAMRPVISQYLSNDYGYGDAKQVARRIVDRVFYDPKEQGRMTSQQIDELIKSIKDKSASQSQADRDTVEAWWESRRVTFEQDSDKIKVMKGAQDVAKKSDAWTACKRTIVDSWTEYIASERPRRDFIRVHLENDAMNDELQAEYERDSLREIFKQDDDAEAEDAKAEADHDVDLKAKAEAKIREQYEAFKKASQQK